MSRGNDLVPMAAATAQIPIAQMRNVYRLDDVEKRLDKLPAREHETLRATYERMLEKGPERFQVKPSGLPAMEHLYDELPNFHEVLDDLKRQLALCTDSRDALEITPMLLLGPPGIGKTHFAREIAHLLGTGLGFISMSSLTAGWVLSGASSQWKGARPGKVFEKLVDGNYANPVMVVDEIDKARAEHAYDPLGALYSLLEHDTAQNFVLRREGNIEAILACLGTLPRKKIRENSPAWLREIRELKLKPHKGRLKDLKVIDRLIKDLKTTLLDAQEKKVSVRGRKSSQPAAAEQPQKRHTPNQPVK